MEFRQDINALRAVAVVAVLLFHFKAPGASGGFTGVDVFFVISGYLMTRIILGRIQEGDFDIGAFYLARVRRLVPALAAMCAGLMAFGLAILDPIALADLSREVVAAMTFTSNVLYLGQSGYFAPEAEASWLLHNWSLAVEWQFYALYPLVLAGLARFGPRLIGPSILVGLAGSLALSLAAPLISPELIKANFYMLPTRVWELLAGAAVAAYGLRLPKIWHWAGLAVVVAGCILIPSDGAWPSAVSILPVVATATILAARHEPAWTRNAAVAGIGAASYSIYLWHWPIIVAARYLDIAIPVWAGLILSVLAGLASYRLIEVGLGQKRFPIRSWARAAIVGAPLAALSAGVSAANGLETIRLTRFSQEDQARIRDYRDAKDDWAFVEICANRRLCRFGSEGGTLVIGDSHAQQYAPRYRSADGVTFVTASGCPVLPGVGRGERLCSEFYDEAIGLARSGDYDHIVLISAWGLYFRQGWTSQPDPPCFAARSDCLTPKTQAGAEQAVEQAMHRLAADIRAVRATGADVTLFLPTPYSESLDPRAHYRRALSGGSVPHTTPRSDLEAPQQWIRARLISLAQASGANVFDPMDQICDPGCPTHLQGRSLFKDQHHFRSSAVLSPAFAWVDHGLRVGLDEE